MLKTREKDACRANNRNRESQSKNRRFKQGRRNNSNVAAIAIVRNSRDFPSHKMGTMYNEI